MSTIVNILLKCFVNDRVFLFICLYVSLISVICVAVMHCDMIFLEKPSNILLQDCISSGDEGLQLSVDDHKLCL